MIVAGCVCFCPGYNILLRCWVTNRWDVLYHNETRPSEPCMSKDTLPTLCQTDRQTSGRHYLQNTIRKTQQDEGSFDLCQRVELVTCNGHVTHVTLSHVMELLGQTVWHPALVCALINLFLLTSFLPPKLLPVCRTRVKEAKNWDGIGTRVCKAFGELSRVLCFLHRGSNPLIPKLAYGRAGW